MSLTGYKFSINLLVLISTDITTLKGIKKKDNGYKAILLGIFSNRSMFQ